ncbi:MAG: RodZ domain-containing protein, partial [Acidimicrobiales bacterium]
VQHYRPKWLADIHLTRHSPASPSPSTQPAAARTSRGRHTARGQEGSPSQLVSTTGSGAGTESVVVRSGDYAVVVDAREPCWIEATGPPGGSGPVFAGVVQAGQTKVLDPVAGRLTVQFGASLVTVQVEVAGKAVNGWSFSPKTVPFTLSFASSPSF